MTKYKDLPQDIQQILQNISSGELIDIAVMAAHANYNDYADCPHVADRRWMPPGKSAKTCAGCIRHQFVCVGCWVLWLIDGIGKARKEQ